jgi:hypothetical protein
MDLIQGVMAILSGGATGLLGVIAQRLFDHWKIKQENDRLLMIHKHDLDKLAAETAHMKEEWAQRGKMAGFMKGFGWMTMVLLDTARGIVRPGLTLYLCWIATKMYDQSRAALAIVGESETVLIATVHAQIVYTMLYLFTTCVLWWFGTRNKQKPPKTA